MLTSVGGLVAEVAFGLFEGFEVFFLEAVDFLVVLGDFVFDGLVGVSVVVIGFAEGFFGGSLCF